MVDFNSDMCTANGIPLVGIAWLAGFQIREWVVGLWVFRVIRGDRILSMSGCLFGGPEEMTKRACQKLNTGGGSVLACL